MPSHSTVRSSSVVRVLTIVLLLTTLGCAQQQVRDDAQNEFRAGRYEDAVVKLEEGLKRYPDSALLRGGLLQLRREAGVRLLADAAAARAAGRHNEAERLLRRAKELDPANDRIESLLFDLATERRQRAALGEAERLLSDKQQGAALRLVTEALKDNPRHPSLLALQRRIEIDVRQAQVKASQAGLIEVRPISLDFRDASLRSVLDVVSRNSGINFILDKDIRAETGVTVFIRSAKVEDAIDLIASTYQLAKKVIDPQTILIYPNTQEKQREHQEQIVKVFYLASAEAKGAASFLKSMLRIRDPYVDERTNMLALRDSADNIHLAERLVALYDAQEPEVMLEVEVIEISSSRLTELGVKFPDTFSLTPLAPLGAARLTLGNVEALTRNDIALSVGGVMVNLRREVGDFNTLANPRIRAKNKEKARIMIGDKIPVITVTAGGSGGFVSDSVNYIDVGLKLDVEPTVYADDDVAIRVGLEVSTLGSQVRTNSGSLAYQIGTRNASTLLRLRDGETQILAGLISNQDRSASSRIPGIGDLPVLGRLFSNQRDDGQRTELVLAITPRVVRNVRRPDAHETELWVGTEAAPRLRAIEGRLDSLSAPVSTDPASAPPRMNANGRATRTRLGESRTPLAAPTFKWVAPNEVNKGEEFVVTLFLGSPVALRGAPVQLAYSKDLLSIQSVEEGDFFKQDGASTTFTRAIDAAAGRVQAGGLRSDGTGAAGLGSVLSVRVTAIESGVAEISALSVVPAGTDGTVPNVVVPPRIKIAIK